jgi:hypothetical protein
MEDVLELYPRKHDDREPVVCLDERPVVLHADARRGRPMAPGRVARRDYEYVRGGTAEIEASLVSRDLGRSNATQGRCSSSRTPRLSYHLPRGLRDPANVRPSRYSPDS